MMRLLHMVAISGLIGSAAYVYTIKYETLFYAEELTKLRQKIAREADAIAVAKAEYALLTRPDRLQRMVDLHLDLKTVHVGQMARLSDLPNRPPKTDDIARKLELLGMETGSTTPKDKRVSDARTPSAPRAPAR